MTLAEQRARRARIRSMGATLVVLAVIAIAFAVFVGVLEIGSLGGPALNCGALFDPVALDGIYAEVCGNAFTGYAVVVSIAGGLGVLLAVAGIVLLRRYPSKLSF